MAVAAGRGSDTDGVDHVAVHGAVVHGRDLNPLLAVPGAGGEGEGRRIDRALGRIEAGDGDGYRRGGLAGELDLEAGAGAALVGGEARGRRYVEPGAVVVLIGDRNGDGGQALVVRIVARRGPHQDGVVLIAVYLGIVHTDHTDPFRDVPCAGGEAQARLVRVTLPAVAGR